MNNLTVEIFDDKTVLGQAAADFVAQNIRNAIAEKGKAAIMFATGASQYEFLDALIKIQDVDWSKVTAFHLDEYINLPENHPASFRSFLRERLFKHLTFRAVHLLNGNAANPEKEGQRYADLLSAQEIDVCCVGIGENGHLAFNDPPADFDTPNLVQVVELAESSRQQQVSEGHFLLLHDVPRQALSLTIPAVLRSKVISCVVPDARKAKAVHCALKGAISRDCPASALQTHPNCRVFLGDIHPTPKGGGFWLNICDVKQRCPTSRGLLRLSRTQMPLCLLHMVSGCVVGFSHLVQQVDYTISYRLVQRLNICLSEIRTAQ